MIEDRGVNIALRSLDDISDFVNICTNFHNQYGVYIDVLKGRYICDGTSIMGIAGICPSTNTSVRMVSDDAQMKEEFHREIEKYIVD